MPTLEIATSGVEVFDTFGAGGSAMNTNGSWLSGVYFGYEGVEVGMAPTPIGPSGQRASMFNGLAASTVVAAASARIPTRRAVTFTDGDLAEFVATQQAAPSVRVYFGKDGLLPAAVACGARAVIGSLYNFLAPGRPRRRCPPARR